jgi:hypothetical protein
VVWLTLAGPVDDGSGGLRDRPSVAGMSSPGSAFAVQTDRLRALADTLSDAAAAATAVVEHAGVVRGRAQDGGDDELRQQAGVLADRWEHGLGLMIGHSRRMADALRLAADCYDCAEQLAAADAGR